MPCFLCHHFHHFKKPKRKNKQTKKHKIISANCCYCSSKFETLSLDTSLLAFVWHFFNFPCLGSEGIEFDHPTMHPPPETTQRSEDVRNKPGHKKIPKPNQGVSITYLGRTICFGWRYPGSPNNHRFL